MSSPLNICNIVCENKEDYDLVVEYLKNYPITVVDKFENVKNTSPTLIVGWQFVKILFPKHNIVDFEIKPGLFWVHSKQDLKSRKISEQYRKFCPELYKIVATKQFFVI